MAVKRAGRRATATPARRPVLEGLWPVRGSGRLVLLRCAVQLLSALPLALVAAAAASSAARQPYFTDVAGQLTAAHLLRLGEALSPGLLGALAISVVLFVLASQIVTAGAIAWLDPAIEREEGDRVLAVVAREGVAPLLALLRILLASLLLLAAGAVLLRWLFASLALHGEAAGWSGRALLVDLRLAEVATLLCWSNLVGAWALWCRVLTVADGRRRVRRTALLALQVLRQHPLRTAGLYLIVNVAAAALSLGLLALWRQHPPQGVWSLLPWAAAWLVVLAIKAWAWHWLLRAGRLLYGLPELDELRGCGDLPLRPLRQIELWLRLLTRRVG